MEFNQEQTDAYQKAAFLCSKSEKCANDILHKLTGWGLDENDSEVVLDRLVEEKFVDDERYARSFVRDKFRFNKWGKVKISFQLRAKWINPRIIDIALQEIDSETYWEVLVDLLREKNQGLKIANPYELKAKLMRFAQSRGFEMDLIYSAIDEILNE